MEIISFGEKKKRITAIQQGVKNPNRVNVFVDGVYSFSLDIAQLVDLKIKVGSEVDENNIIEFKKASELGKLYQRALEWIMLRPRSIRETRDYLLKKIKTLSVDFPTDTFLDNILVRLIEKKYLDDQKFAEWYVANRFVKKGISQRRLKMELTQKGVDDKIISEVLKERSDEDEILKIIAKKRSRYADDKLIAYLCRQGFAYQLAQDLVRSYETD